MNLYVCVKLAVMERAYRFLHEKNDRSKMLVQQENRPTALCAFITIASELAVATRDIIDFVARIDTDAKHQAA